MADAVGRTVAEVVRQEWPRVVSTLVGDLGSLDLAEDAAQEAVEVALARWPHTGVPDRPGAWITTVARRRAIDVLRRERSGVEKLVLAARLEERIGCPAEPLGASELHDEQLRLVFACCHPALSVEAQVALTLRCVAGLTTREVAAAFLVPETTMAQRLVRAKRKIAAAAIPFRIPPDAELLTRLGIVHHVVYLVFNQGYATAEGDALVDVDLGDEALRLGRLLADLVPDDAETLGLVALMALVHARRPARLDVAGELVLLADQDRSQWDAELVAEGLGLLDRAVRLQRPGPYQVQAAINAVHAEALVADQTDWRQIVGLYRTLASMTPGPVVALNQAVAVAEVDGPEAGLALVDSGPAHELDAYRYLHAARADLLRRLGRDDEAASAYRRALELTAGSVERRFLERRLASIDPPR